MRQYYIVLNFCGLVLPLYFFFLSVSHSISVHLMRFDISRKYFVISKYDVMCEKFESFLLFAVILPFYGLRQKDQEMA